MIILLTINLPGGLRFLDENLNQNSIEFLAGNLKDYFGGNSKIRALGSVRRKTGVAGLEFEAGQGYEWLTQAACLSSQFLSGQDEWVRGGVVGRKGGVGGVWRPADQAFYTRPPHSRLPEACRYSACHQQSH